MLPSSSQIVTSHGRHEWATTERPPGRSSMAMVDRWQRWQLITGPIDPWLSGPTELRELSQSAVAS